MCKCLACYVHLFLEFYADSLSHLCKILKLVFQAFPNLNVVEFRFIFLLGFGAGMKYSIKI